MKLSIHFAPPSKDVLPDDLEAWIPESSRDFDVGTFALAAVPSTDEMWGQQAAAAAAGLGVRNEGGHPVVTGIYDESPAAKFGVKVRDRVLSGTRDCLSVYRRSLRGQRCRKKTGFEIEIGIHRDESLHFL